MLQEKDFLEIPIESRYGIIKLFIYGQSTEAKLYEMTPPFSGESKWQLLEGCTYAYELVSDENLKLQIARDYPEIISYHPSPRHPSEGILKTGIYVGQLTLKILKIDSQEECAKTKLEIRSVKSEYESDYRSMLNDIAEYYTDLVLQQGSPVTQHLEIAEDLKPQTLYQRFSFIRGIIDSETFSEAIHKIVANPVRKWTESSVEKNIVAVRRLSRGNIRQLTTATDRIKLQPHLRKMLPYGLQSVPRTMSINYKKDTVDNQENQFVKFVLRSFSSFCTDLQSMGNASDRLKAEAEQTASHIASYLDSQFFRQVSMPTHMNMNSPVLQRKEGYREVLQAWLAFDLAARLNWEGGDDVYDAEKKNVATLYEYWLFFKLIQLVSEFFELDKAEKSELVKTDADNINLDLKQGRMKVLHGQNQTFSRLLNVAFYYNRTFYKVGDDETSIHKAGSWTMAMRPDYTLSLWPGEIKEEEAERQELIVHLHFDAKYRLNKIILQDDKDAKLLTDELSEEKEQQELGFYKRADLLKMHAYKDAIRRTSGAYVLYPGTENREIKGFHEIIPGLGAFRIRPGHWQEDSIPLKQFLAEVKAHLLDRMSEREKLSFYQYNIYKEANRSMLMENLPEAVDDYRDFMPDETNVIIGYCADENREFLTSDENHFYNMRTDDRGGAQSLDIKKLSAKYILLWDKEGWCQLFKLSIRGPKVVSIKNLVEKGYITSEMQKLMIKQSLTKEEAKERANLDGFYLVFTYNKIGLEKELQQYTWKINDIKKEQSSPHKPFVLTLDKLMKYAVKKDG